MSNQFVFAEPKVEPSFTCFGIAGATGTGKTWSAMEIMVGLVGDGNFAVLDTEQGRAIHYHKKRLGNKGFEFLHAPFNPPYSPLEYKKGVEAAAKQGVKGLLIDSGSHMWEGDGGMQDMVEKRTIELAQKYNTDRDKVQFSAWRKPKEDAWEMIQFAKSCGLHVGICFRAKSKSKMTKVPRKNGGFKTEIVPIGWQPITDSQIPYEMDWFATLDPENPGVPEFTYKALAEQFRNVFKPGDQMSRKHGAELIKWCNQNSSSERESTKPAPSADDEKVTIYSHDGRSKEVSRAKAIDGLLASMRKCKSTEDVWGYINNNSELTSSYDAEARDKFEKASAAIVEQVETLEADEAMDAA